jgi:bifunctional non-homologous end joining protein LigD
VDQGEVLAAGEYAIVGFEPEGKLRIAALHLAKKCQGNAWGYMGKVGTGFSDESVELRKRLDELAVESPVVVLANRRRSAIAVKPILMAKVEYRTITADGQLRHAAFKGLAWSAVNRRGA